MMLAIITDPEATEEVDMKSSKGRAKAR
jgi:hypothetical protein